MDAKAKPIQEILHTGDQYIIPLFQRYYSWKIEHWRRLCDDLRAVLAAEEQRIHFLGPMVCSSTKHVPGSPPTYHLIDGQQRMTTITLLLAAIRDEARDRGVPLLANQITEQYLVDPYRQDLERFHLVPRLGDREAFVQIVEGHWEKADQELQICQAYRFLRRQVAFLARGDAEARLKRIFHTVADRLHLVVICIDGENPYEIFDSLNSTGLPLAESDLIRNYVFMQVPMKEQDSFHAKQWLPFERMFDATGDYPALDLTAFYRDYGMRDGAYTERSAAFQTYREQTKASGSTPGEQVAELVRYAGYYLKIQRPSTCADAQIGNALRALRMLDVGTATPLLLHLMERHGTDQIDKATLVAVLGDLASFVLRRSVCGDSTRTYGRWFVEAITAIKRDVRGDLRNYWVRRGWPDDASFVDELAHFPIYKREHRKCRLILERLEESFGHKEQVVLDKLTIEHVMPQAIGDSPDGVAWRAMLGADWEADHTTLLHTLGNLTLTGYNPELSNREFAVKQGALLDSHVVLNKHFKDTGAWNRQAIETRGAKLARTVAALWPCPAGAEHRAMVPVGPSPDLSPTKQFYLRYWRALESLIHERGSTLAMVELPTSTECRFKVDLPEKLGASLWVSQMRKEKSLVAAFGIKCPGSVRQQVCEAMKGKIGELAMAGGSVEWHDEWPGLCFADRSGVNFGDEDDWEIQHNWLVDSLERLRDALVPCVKEQAETIDWDAGTGDEQTTTTEQQRFEFWAGFRDFLVGEGTHLKPRNPHPQNWYDFSLGRTGYWLSAIVSTRSEEGGSGQPELRVGLVCQSDEGHCLLNDLAERRKELEDLVDAELVWGMKNGVKDWRLYCRRAGDFRNREDWPKQFAWLKEKVELFHATFHPMIHAQSSAKEGSPDQELTTTRQQQLDFWTGFREFVNAGGSTLSPGKPCPGNWYPFSIGKTDYCLAAIATVCGEQGSPEMRVEFVCFGDQAHGLLINLKDQYKKLEDEFGAELVWHMQEGLKKWKVSCHMDTDFRDQDKWPDQFAWLKAKLELFHATFRPMIFGESSQEE